MKVAIISDIHDNQFNLRKCLGWCSEHQVKAVFCCGDVTNVDTIEILSRCFDEEIHLVKGNADLYIEEDLADFNIEYHGRMACFQFDKFRVGMCHEPYLIEKVFEKKCDIIFYGHTHRPFIDDHLGVPCVNPGTLSGMFAMGTFAVWNTENGDLEMLRVDEI